MTLEEKEICQAIADYVSKKMGRRVYVNVGINVHSRNGASEKVEAVVTERDGETK